MRRISLNDNPECRYVAFIPELKGCITTGISASDALLSLDDAKEAWFSSALENGDPIPEPSTLKNYSGEFKLRMPKSLHRRLMERSKEEGVSMNQYCVMLLSQGEAYAAVNNSNSAMHA